MIVVVMDWLLIGFKVFSAHLFWVVKVLFRITISGYSVICTTAYRLYQSPPSIKALAPGTWHHATRVTGLQQAWVNQYQSIFSIISLYMDFSVNKKQQNL
jgi:hypothetical protein